LFLISDYTRENRGRLLNTIMKLEENEDFSFGGITMEQSQNYVMKEDEILLSHKDKKYLNCFSYDIGMEEIVVAEDKEEHFDVVFDDYDERKIQQSVDVDNNKFQQRVYQSKNKLNK